MSGDLWTIGDVIRWSAEYLRSHHSESPRLDAELMLAHCLNCKRIDLYLQFDKPLTASERGLYRDAIKRRSQGEPVAYILGRKEFFGLDFVVNRNVLIPRPDTEILVENAQQFLKLQKDVSSLKALDLGTGSGCIAISLAHLFPRLSVDAWDVSPEALSVAKQNAALLGVDVRFVQSNALEEASWDDVVGSYDLICSNPPYISLSERDQLPLSVINYEPQQALFADHDGLIFYQLLASYGYSALKDSGLLLAEIGYAQATAVSEIFTKTDRWSVEILKDIGGNDRLLVASKNA